ncbi:MAG: DUF21 domain-containing protein [Muribaculaceae bacterium]|nr:DUF21 domain-containing protein [Muribaculaceae bacterium]
MDTDPLPSSSPLAALILLSARALEFKSPENWVAWCGIVLIAIFCLLVSAFVSGSEIAYFGLNQSEVDALEEEDDPQAQKACRLLANSEQLLATILISNNLVNITMVVLLSFAFNQVIEVHNSLLDFLLQTVLLTFLLLLFGEIFPKLVARGKTVKWVRFASSPLTVFFNILYPISKIMMRSSYLVNNVVTKNNEKLSTD